MTARVGFGFDVHRLAEHRDFMVGGVKIPHIKGSLGHSDADVLIHAIIDALLGAAALGDIGQHFPDTSPDYKNIDSKVLLLKTMALLRSHGYSICNIDSTVVLQQPKLMPHIPAMKETLCPLLEIPLTELSIKAKTNEKMGFIGREEGVAAYAVALIEKEG